MRAGYYYTYWPEDPALRVRYWRKCRGYVNLYMDWQLGDRWPILIGKKLWIDLGMYGRANETAAYVDKVLDALRGKWDKIIALELRDEPPWPKAKLEAMAKMVKGRIAAKGLSPKPIGVTLTEEDVLAGKGTARFIDYVGIEAYLKYVAGESGAGAQQRMKAQITKLLAHVPSSKKIMLVGQTYDRNGTWKNVDTLVAIQEPIFSAARALDEQGRLIALAMFAFARTGGAMAYNNKGEKVGYPELEAEIKRLLK